MQDRHSGYLRVSGDATDLAMLSAARERDRRAWEQIVDQYSALVYHWCRRSGLGPEDAADVLQSVMLKLAQNLPKFENDGQPASFRRWLATVTRTCVADLIRADRRQPRGPGGTDALARLSELRSPCESGSSVATSAAFRNGHFFEALAEVEAAVGTKTWEAFRLTVFEQLTSIEAGARLQMTPAAVRLAKARVLQKLRTRLEQGIETNTSSVGAQDGPRFAV